MKGKELRPYTAFEKFANRYENNNPLLPFMAIGFSAAGLGVIDRLFCKKAADFSTKRLENLMIEMEKRILKEIREPASDVFIPALYQVIPGILESQSEEKLRMFAEILSGAWNQENSSWDEVAQSLRLVRQLEDIHILILRKALELSPQPEGAVVTFSIDGKGYSSSIAIEDHLPKIETMFITSCVSDLISLGLINDSFAMDSGGSFGFGSTESQLKESPQAYSISPLGRWLLERIAGTHRNA